MNILRHLAFIPLFFHVQILYGQKRPPVRPLLPPPPEAVSGDVCAKNANLAFTTRIKKYPFNVSTQVQLIAFEGQLAISSDGEFTINQSEIHLTGVYDTTGYIGMKESRALTFPQIDTLTGILYNYGFPRITAQKIITIKREYGCYIPRNAILFRDSNGKALAFIEICFECMGARLSDKRISLGETCSEKLDMIRDFFRKAGIKYGVEKGEEAKKVLSSDLIQ